MQMQLKAAEQRPAAVSKEARIPADQSLPRPAFVTDAWLREHGVSDPAALFAALRDEDSVMTEPALRAKKATRVSFVRSLMRRVLAKRWKIEKVLSEVDAGGAGFVFYTIEAEGASMYYGVISMPSIGRDRTGRLADDVYDLYAVLGEGQFDFDRTKEDLKSIADNVWASRVDRCLGISIANRSTRVFDHVVERLAEGRPPDLDVLLSGGGYILRNAGWYGNGRHGSRSWRSMTGHPLGYPYHADMFALYMWRIASIDLVEAAARVRNPAAATLPTQLKRGIGVGNNSGMGMVAALVRWPEWMGSYNTVRELCLAHAMIQKGPDPERAGRLAALVQRAADYYLDQSKLAAEEAVGFSDIADALFKMTDVARDFVRTGQIEGRVPDYPWKAVSDYARSLGNNDAYEQTNSLLIEIFPEFADAMATLLPAAMATDRNVRPAMTIEALRDLLRRRYGWALALDLTSPESRHHFWYRSQDSGENRRGERHIDQGSENETFVDVAGSIQALNNAIAERPGSETVGRFLFEYPEFTQMAARAQLADRMPYTEIRANIIHRDFLPSDGIKFLLSTMGLEASRSNNVRYVRGVFLQGAPLPEEIARGAATDWLYPKLDFPKEHAAP